MTVPETPENVLIPQPGNWVRVTYINLWAEHPELILEFWPENDTGTSVILQVPSQTHKMLPTLSVHMSQHALSNV
jgi:hypothetical protein